MKDIILALFNYLKNKLHLIWKKSKYCRFIFIVAVLILTRNIYLKYYRKYKNLPPGTLGLPVIGDAFSVFKMSWYNAGPGSYDCLASFCLGPMNVVCINNPDLVKSIYSDPRTCDVPIDKNLDVFTNKNGSEWFHRRTIMVNNLHLTMKSLFVESATKEFISTKVFPIINDKILLNESICCRELFRPLGFNLVLLGFFGEKLTSLNNDPFWISNNKLLIAMSNDRKYDWILSFFFPDILKDKIMNLFGLISFKKTFDNMTNSIDKYSINHSNKITQNLFNNNNNNKYTKKQLCGDLAMLFIGAIRTTYSSLTFALLMAAKYPIIQQELYNEINNAFNGNINNITLRNDNDIDGILQKIPKLRAFIHENIRINSPLPLNGFREITVDGFKINTSKYCLKNNKIYDIPKGTKLVVNVWNILHSPKWWVKNYDSLNNQNKKNINMNEIHFEFWIDSNGKFNKKRNIDKWLTFGKGKRNCLGEVLAIKQITIVLAMIFMKYKIYGPNGNSNFSINHKMRESIVPVNNKIIMKLRDT